MDGLTLAASPEHEELPYKVDLWTDAQQREAGLA